jgi:DNA-binding MarR family transcriptional regulator
MKLARRATPGMADASHRRLQQADGLGHEAGLRHDDHAALKLWLRMLACTTQIEDRIRRRLQQAHGISLSRFDFLAQLHRHPDGLRMSELSRHLMVTGGNVTGLTDQLEAEGWVQRDADPVDGRAWLLRLTDDGRRGFERMAAEHEAWVVELMQGLDAPTRQQLYRGLGALRVSLLDRVD